MANNLLLGGYSSFFELSAAFNFAYTASSQFRDTIKNGFLSDSRNLIQRIKNNISDLTAKLTVISKSGQIDLKHKKSINTMLKKTLSKLVINEAELQSAIDEAQANLTVKIKPLYIISALFSFFVLYLIGQESYHNLFPYSELYVALIGISLLMTYIIIATIKSSKEVLLIYISFASIIIFIVSIFLESYFSIFLQELPKQIQFSYKNIVNYSMAISIFPFMFAYTRLFFNALSISIKYQYKLYRINKMINDINSHLDTKKVTDDFFNNL